MNIYTVFKTTVSSFTANIIICTSNPLLCEMLELVCFSGRLVIICWWHLWKERKTNV